MARGGCEAAAHASARPCRDHLEARETQEQRFSSPAHKKERVEQAIADDVAFLAAHPTRMKRGTS
jgi:hypothetical protein